MRIIILGDSHTISLAKGVDYLKRNGDIPDDMDIKTAYLYPGYKIGTEFYWRDETSIRFKGVKLKQKLKAVLGSKQINSSHSDIIFGFSSGFYHRGLMETMLREKILPWNVMPHISGVRRISSSEMNELVLGFNKYLFRFFLDLKSLGIKFFLIPPPAPRRDDRIGKIPPATNGHILIDPLCRAIVKTWYDQNNIDYLTPLPDTTDNGALKAIYCEYENNDDHHGNAQHGALMIQSLLNAV